MPPNWPKPLAVTVTVISAPGATDDEERDLVALGVAWAATVPASGISSPNTPRATPKATNSDANAFLFMTKFPLSLSIYKARDARGVPSRLNPIGRL